MGAVGRVLLGLIGAVLLLPGLCSAGFMIFVIPDFARGRNMGDATMLIAMWAVGFAIAWGGLLLLRKAFGGGRI